MPRTQATDWWTDVQDQREDLKPTTGRNPLEWSDDDFDLIPSVVGTRGTGRPHGFVHVDELAAVRRRGFAGDDTAATGAAREVLLTSDEPVVRNVVLTTGDEPAGREIVLTTGDAATAADVQPEAAGAPAPAARRTVQITGNPERRRPPMTPQERVAHRPDRIAMWAAVFGFVLLLVALASSSDASAATLVL